MAFSEAEKKDRQGSLFTCGYLIHNKEVVKKIHDIVAKAHDAGIPVVVIGDRDHQEVKATNGWCGFSAYLIGDAEEAGKTASELKDQKPIIVCQTTIKEELLNKLISMTKFLIQQKIILTILSKMFLVRLNYQ